MAQSQLANDETLLPPLRQQLSVARHALAILLGQAAVGLARTILELNKFVLPAGASRRAAIGSGASPTPIFY